MKLLFDENLSPSLASRLADVFPDSTHVFLQGLGEAEDPSIWNFAKVHGFAIVSKDTDFAEKGMQDGPPPKVICITLGNCTTRQVESLLRMRHTEIAAFGANADEAVLLLP